MTSKKSAAKKKVDVAPLVPEGVDSSQISFDSVPVAAIVTGQNVRTSFDDEKQAELVASVKAIGLLEPLLVSIAPDEKFTLVSGERRLRAAVSCGYEQVPAVIYPPLTEVQLNEIMLHENLIRADLNPVEEARGFQRLIAAGLSQTKLASRMGVSQPQIANRLRMLEAPEWMLNLVISREITPRHVLAVQAYKDRVWYPQLLSFLEHHVPEFSKLTVGEFVGDSRCGLYRFLEDSYSNTKADSQIINVNHYLLPEAFSAKCPDCKSACRIPIVDMGVTFCDSPDCIPAFIAARLAEESSARSSVSDCFTFDSRADDDDLPVCCSHCEHFTPADGKKSASCSFQQCYISTTQDLRDRECDVGKQFSAKIYESLRPLVSGYVAAHAEAVSLLQLAVEVSEVSDASFRSVVLGNAKGSFKSGATFGQLALTRLLVGQWPDFDASGLADLGNHLKSLGLEVPSLFADAAAVRHGLNVEWAAAHPCAFGGCHEPVSEKSADKKPAAESAASAE